MEESKYQHRTRIIEETSTSSPALPKVEKEHWPVGPLPDVPLSQDIDQKSLGNEDEKHEEKLPKRSNDGSDEWSVSWP